MTDRQGSQWVAALLVGLLCALSAAGAQAGGEGGPDAIQVLIMEDPPASRGLDLSITVDPPSDGAAANDLSGAGLDELSNPRDAARERRIPEDWQLQPPNQGRFRGPRTY